MDLRYASRRSGVQVHFRAKVDLSPDQYFKDLWL